MNGGVLNVTDGTGRGNVYLGMVSGSSGSLIMSGGTVNISSNLSVGAASNASGFLQVLDGVINIDGILTRHASAASTLVDVWDGTIILHNKDWTTTADSWISSGYLTAFGGAAGKEIEVIYDGTNTLITAIPVPSVIGLFLFGSAGALLVRRYSGAK